MVLSAFYYSANGNPIYTPRQFNFSYLENQTQRKRIQFDQQNNFTMEVVKNHDHYQM